jgi:hypothetical protein
MTLSVAIMVRAGALFASAASAALHEFALAQQNFQRKVVQADSKAR